MTAFPSKHDTPIQARLVMYYLRRYTEGSRERRGRLAKLVNKMHGVKTGNKIAWRDMALRVDPSASRFLTYLAFLHEQKAIRAPKKGERGLWMYTHPELLRPGKAKP